MPIMIFSPVANFGDHPLDTVKFYERSNESHDNTLECLEN